MSISGCGPFSPGLGRSGTLLVDGSVRLGELLLEGEGAEGLLVLGQIVAEDVPESFGLLGTEVDALEVADVQLLRVLLGHCAEDEEEVPDAHTDLDAVGVTVTIIVGGGELERGLFYWGFGLAHGIVFRAIEDESADKSTERLVRKRGLEPPRIAPPDPKFTANKESIA